MKIASLPVIPGLTSRTLEVMAVLVWILSGSSYTYALEPPRHGEVDELRRQGVLGGRLDFARALGNNRFDPSLVEKARTKERGYKAMLPSSRQGMPTVGNVKVLAILIAFDDMPFTNSAASINDKLFGQGSPTDFPLESLAHYYSRSSYGQLDLSSGNTLEWYTTAYSRGSIPETTNGREGLIMEVIDYWDDKGHDFSQYDNDSDGDIDYVIVIWTGPDNGWANFWWGYQTYFTDSSYIVDGVRLSKYSWQWESNPQEGSFSPRTAIHETGHALGLPDYYDYDDTIGPDGGVGGLDMMDGTLGDHNCFSKWMLNWIAPTMVSSGTESLTLGASGSNPDAAVMVPAGGNGEIFSEFFMVQNRRKEGNDDQSFPAGGDGILIWHVDARLNNSGNDFAYDNSYTSHKLLKLMEADGLEEIETNGGLADSGDYYKQGSTFGPASTPSSNTYGAIFSGITVDGFSTPGSSMTATFSMSCGNSTVESGENCDDGNMVGGDCCSPNCQYEPQGSSCDDGLFCNGTDTCDEEGTCDVGAAPSCDDGVGCTDDSCDEVSDICVNAVNEASCDDGAFCNGVETCDAVLDCQAGAAVNCDDGVGCTDDSCDEVSDICVNAVNEASCDDGAFCNGVETCDAVLDCQAGAAVNCDDGVGCTDDSCDEVSDICVNAVNEASCDDGAFCNGVETCDAVLDCQAGAAVNCDDGVGCTDDSCDETADVCVYAPKDANCDDGAFCNGVETCDAVLDCQAGAAVNCDDGVGCTDDSCDETADVCVYAPNDANCDDTLFCNGSETCDPALDCQSGTSVDCNDGVVHSIPGVACKAFNNNQAKKLERSHIRLYNPPSNTMSLWVICPIQRTQEDLSDSDSTPNGYVNTYWGSDVAKGAQVNCIVREYMYSTTNAADTRNSVMITAYSPFDIPTTRRSLFELQNDFDESPSNYWTVTCQLPPGTGINSIDFNHQ